MSSTHFEPYRSGDSSIVYAPITATQKLDVYASMRLGDETVNCTIKNGQNATERLREISTAFAKSYRNIKMLAVPGGPNGGQYEITYQAVEIKKDGEIGLSDNNVRAVITSAVRAVRPTATVKVYDYDDVILVLMRAA